MKTLTFSRDASIFSPSNSLVILLCLCWGNEMVRYFRAVLLHIPGLSDIAPATEQLLYTLFTLLSISEIVKRIKAFDLIFVASIYIVYLFTYLLFPENTDGLDEYAPRFLSAVIPCYFIGRVMDINEVKPLFYKVSVISIALSAVYHLFIFQASRGAMDVGSENMASSYGVLPHVLFVVWMALEKPNIIDILLSLFGFFFIVSFGTRGPVICIILFIALYLIFVRKYKDKILATTIIVILALVIVFYINELMLLASNAISALGMSTRILDFIMDDVALESQGRDELNVIAFRQIRESNGSGYGIAAMSRWTDTYPHNLAIQLWLEFGVIIGSVLLLALCWLLIRAYFKTKDYTERCFFIILFLLGFLHLFLSHTYLTVPHFFMLIGYAIILIDKNKKKLMQL